MRLGPNLPEAEGGGEEGDPGPQVVDQGGEAEAGVVESESFERGIDDVHGGEVDRSASDGGRRGSECGYKGKRRGQDQKEDAESGPKMLISMW